MKVGSGIDQFFLKAEQLANDFSLFPRQDDSHAELKGVLSGSEIDAHLEQLRGLDVDSYVERTVAPSESPKRIGAKGVLKHFVGEVIRREQRGPLLAAEMKMDLGDGIARRIGILAQERTASNGVWMPEHHLRSVEIIREFSSLSLPIVTLMDTPGADAGAQANQANQAHCISRLIAEFAQIDVPIVGVILGNGYSGGAIPLATSNILLSVRDGVFNTIHPRGLASIARKYDLSWQECAKYIGVSAFELYKQGYLDAIIDFVPGEKEKTLNLMAAIGSAILSVEQRSREFVKNNPYVFDHYVRNTMRFLEPSETLQQRQELAGLSLYSSPTNQGNIFGVSYRYLRYLGLRKRITSTTVKRYARLSIQDIPKGDLSERTAREHRLAFKTWLENPLEIKYDDVLLKSWNLYSERLAELNDSRGKLARMIFGDPESNYREAIRSLSFTYGFHLYNLWKSSAQNNFRQLIEYLSDPANTPCQSIDEPRVLDVLLQDDIRRGFLHECENLVVFDQMYNNIVSDLKLIANEAKEHNTISDESVSRLLQSALKNATDALIDKKGDDASLGRRRRDLESQFFAWMALLIRNNRRGKLLKSVEEWKKIVFPRVSEPLLAVITFFFEHLLPEYYTSLQTKKKTYNGRINPRNIGLKDFWNRLTIAYQDLLISDELLKVKRQQRITPQAIIDKYFGDFEESSASLMTADPAEFPGFRISIEQSLSKGIVPCGCVTGIAKLKVRKVRRRVGVLISNLTYQAGAWDMASTEKLCKLLVECARRRIPVICFISSGGMQTKEGAGALFSMSICNDRITRFVRDNDIPVVCFAFGDCTGGAQASFVTHPLVSTYYFSGTNMPFAGQIVVPSHLPCHTTLSNYLSTNPGSMKGLVQNPFAPELDETLAAIDPEIPVAKETVEEVIVRELKYGPVLEEVKEEQIERRLTCAELMRPFDSVLVHARGCTAEKIVKKIQQAGKRVVLVQSDPDMESVAADALRDDQDQLICLGGSTPDESYLNAASIIRIAEHTKVDALHPGIGFLSENPHFADLCRTHQINFIGPPVESMQLMGNKSNAINTAIKMNVPVVPGSFGVVTNPQVAAKLAEEIGYPVIIKAVYGGGGKGIIVVNDPQRFTESFLQIMAEAKSAFGNSDVYLEKYITSLRHVEVQILRDKHGNTRVLGLRDCSVQRNNQKMIEESGSTMLAKKLEKNLYTYAASIADAVNYLGAATVEFIYDLEEKAVYFMEMNTRLQIEHPVTELVTGVDIVSEQLRIAAGESIKDLKLEQKGYAIELRITAEKVSVSNGELDFVPTPGKITECELPQEPDVQVLSAIGKGKTVSSFYDSMIVQLICRGESREDTCVKLLAYLDRVVIKGVCTNIPLLKRILNDEVFRKGTYDTTFLKGFIERIDVDQMMSEINDSAGISGASVSLEALKIDNSDELKVLAPGPGICYLTPNPNEPEYVQAGEVVDVKQTLCLLEAMKLFRPLTLASFNTADNQLYAADTRYEVVRVIPANGQEVNRDDLLFVVRPVEEVNE